MARRLRVTLVPAGLALGIAAELVSYRSGELDGAAADLVVGWVLIGCGLLAWDRRGDSRVGPLLAATGVAWFLGSFTMAALYLHRGPLVHALLSFPSGRLSGRVTRAVVGLAAFERRYGDGRPDAIFTVKSTGGGDQPRSAAAAPVSAWVTPRRRGHPTAGRFSSYVPSAQSSTTPPPSWT